MEKKEFVKAEIEVVKLEKNDVIATSMQSVVISGPGPMIEEDEDEE